MVPIMAELHHENSVVVGAGQQQLLCLARVLLQRPSILCLDECTANVDASTAHIMQDLIAAHLRHATILQVIPNPLLTLHAPSPRVSWNILPRGLPSTSLDLVLSKDLHITMGLACCMQQVA